MKYLSPDEVRRKADEIRTIGCTVVEELIPLDLVAAMRDRFDVLMERKRATEPFNRGANRFQMYLPFEPPFADERVFENPNVLAIVETVFGHPADPACLEDVRSICTYFASDTPLPGSDYQRVHSDTQLLFPEERLSLPAYGIVLNIPLVDVTEENGPMECWPGGTHLWPGGSDMAALAEKLAPVRLTMPAGSALIRDLRMWHRGTPNRSDQSRPNVALVYTRPWYRFEQQQPVISRQAWERLSERARRMFRWAAIQDDAA